MNEILARSINFAITHQCLSTRADAMRVRTLRRVADVLQPVRPAAATFLYAAYTHALALCSHVAWQQVRVVR